MNRLVMTAAISVTLCSASFAFAQTQKRGTTPPAGQATASTTIYKLVDESGRITYSNLPLKGASVVELDPLTVLPSTPRIAPAATSTNININAANGSNTPPAQTVAVATVSVPASSSSPMLAMIQPSLPNVDSATQKKRDDTRRKILEDELKAEERLLADAVISLNAHESDRSTVALMRTAAEKQTPAAYAEARRSYEQREEKLRTLQESVHSHEKNLGALKKELAALK